jgi:hypothetical protein
MFDFADLTVYKNTDGVTTALGCPINSFLLQNDRPLFMTGGGSGDQLAVPVGLVCMTKTVCANPMAYTDSIGTEPIDEPDLVPEDLYERLMELAEVKQKPMSSKPMSSKPMSSKPMSSKPMSDKKNTRKKHKKGAVHLAPKNNKTHKKK